MKDRLFNEFPEVSAEQWKQQILADLKDPGEYEKLIYKSPDGVEVQPFYHSEELEDKLEIPTSGSWSVCEKILVKTAAEGNGKAKYAIEKGAESLWFVIPSAEVSPEELLDGIELEEVSIFLQPCFLSEKYFNRIQEYLGNKKHRIFLLTDILGNLAKSGDWFYNTDRDHDQLKQILTGAKGFSSVLSVDTALYQNAGANIPQQLGFAMAHISEYLNFMNSQGLLPSQFKPLFLVASGADYFFEIAKVRALRWLYASLAPEFELPGECHILAEPTRRNKTLYDYNVNLLRTTTESMSAVLGGADTVCNAAYDSIFHESNEFGDRIARNQLLIMKNEAYLDKVANPAEGAYYIESLTRQFAEAALEIFKEIEEKGGFLSLLRSGDIQQRIKESAQKEQDKFDSGQTILIGTNKFMNPQDRILNDLQVDPFEKLVGKSTIEPISEKRLSEKLEQERIEKEKAL